MAKDAGMPSSYERKCSNDLRENIFNSFGKNDLAEIDAYTNLWNKAFETREAVEWETNALRIRKGRN